jgi:threonine/homoserine/homoserine lactone efflux protein
MIFLKALIIGFSIAMPVGPIGMLCIRNTLSYGLRIGFATGLGAALADSCYGFMAGGGLAFLSSFLINNNSLIKIIGSAILLWLGINEIKNARTKIHEIKIKKSSFYKTIATTYLLTITSPMTILSFVGVFAVIGGNNLSGTNIFFIITGIFCGSLLWWLTLAGIVAQIRHKISINAMAKIRISSGIILCAFAAYALISIF